MNVLIGTAVLLVVASATALVVGWSTSQESLYWTSIAASVVAGAVLFAAWWISARGRGRDAATPGPQNAADEAPSPGSPTSRVRLRQTRPYQVTHAAVDVVLQFAVQIALKSSSRRMVVRITKRGPQFSAALTQDELLPDGVGERR